MSELQLIAAANEEIKQVVRVAERISLTSVNAMLVARRADGQAIGFSVVARELRLSSDRMASTMLGLSRLISQLVIATARSRNQARRLKILSLTGRCSPRAQVSIHAALQGSQADAQAMAKQVVTYRKGVLQIIDRTAKQCAMGLVIARSATIEAASGGAMQPVLRQIAIGVETSIDRMSAHIYNVKHQLQAVSA